MLQCLDLLDVAVRCILHSDGVAKPLLSLTPKAIYCVRAGHSLFVVDVLMKAVVCCHVLICRCRTLLFDCILDSDGVAKPLTVIGTLM